MSDLDFTISSLVPVMFSGTRHQRCLSQVRRAQREDFPNLTCGLINGAHNLCHWLLANKATIVVNELLSRNT